MLKQIQFLSLGVVVLTPFVFLGLMVKVPNMHPHFVCQFAFMHGMTTVGAFAFADEGRPARWTNVIGMFGGLVNMTVGLVGANWFHPLYLP